VKKSTARKKRLGLEVRTASNQTNAPEVKKIMKNNHINEEKGKKEPSRKEELQSEARGDRDKLEDEAKGDPEPSKKRALVFPHPLSKYTQDCIEYMHCLADVGEGVAGALASLLGPRSNEAVELELGSAFNRHLANTTMI